MVEHISAETFIYSILKDHYGYHAFPEDDEVQAQKRLQEFLCPQCQREIKENIDWNQFFKDVADEAETHIVLGPDKESDRYTKLGRETKKTHEDLEFTETTRRRLIDGEWVEGKLIDPNE